MVDGIRLLALDLDGTLLDRDSNLTAENRAAVAEALASGVEVVLVTGRSWRSARPYYMELGLTGPAICYLGALVVADESGRVLHHRPLALPAWQELRNMVLSEGLAVTACVGADLAVLEGRLDPVETVAADMATIGAGPNRLIAVDSAFATGPADDFAGWPDWNPYSQVAPDLGPVRYPPTMMAAYGDRAVHRILERFPDGLQSSQFDLTDRIAGEKVLHVWHTEVDKGIALARFCGEQGFDPAHVAAIGDAVMDASMIRFAGVGVAVPGGDERLKMAARWVATPAEAIGRLLRGEHREN